MKRFGLFTLGVVVVAIGAILLLTELTDGSSDNAAVGTLQAQTKRAGLGAEDAHQSQPPEALEDPVTSYDADGNFVYPTDGGGAGGPATGGTGGGDAAGGGSGEVAPPLPALVERKLVRNATVALEVESVASVVGQVEAIALAAGGFVASSSVFVEEPPEPREDGVEPPERTESATLTIRVPSSEYTSVLTQLRDIADEVRSETSTTSDVTEEYTDLEARLRNLEASEAQYLTLLGKAETIPDILTLQDRINAVRLEIERVQGRINLLNDLGDLATVVVQLSPPPVAPEEPGQPGWAQEAWENAWEESKEALETMGTVAIVSGVVLVWLAVPATAIAIAWRVLGPGRPRGGEA
jgi:hypothetical protein